MDSDADYTQMLNKLTMSSPATSAPASLAEGRGPLAQPTPSAPARRRKISAAQTMAAASAMPAPTGLSVPVGTPAQGASASHAAAADCSAPSPARAKSASSPIARHPTSPANTCARVRQLATAPDTVLALAFARLDPASLAHMDGVIRQVLQSVNATVLEADDMVKKRPKRQVVRPQEKLARRLEAIKADAVYLKQQLARGDGVLHLDLQFVIRHDYSNLSLAECVKLATRIMCCADNAHALELLARVEVGKIMLYMRSLGQDAVKEFCSSTGLGKELAYRYMCIANICMAFPMLPFLPHVSWSFLGQHAKHMREFVSQDEDLQEFLSRAPPTIAPAAIVVDQQGFDDDGAEYPQNPFDGASCEYDEVLDASSLDWTHEADYVLVDDDLNEQGRDRLREAGLI